MATLVRKALVVSLMAAASTAAAQSKVSIGDIKGTHPHLYADAAAFQKLRNQIPALERLPGSGSLTFDLTPGPKADWQSNLMVFGDSGQSSGFYIRHTSGETAPTGSFQFVLHHGATTIAAVIFEKAYGEKTTVKVTWDVTAKTLTFDAVGATFPSNSKPKPLVYALPDGWTTGAMAKLFSGRVNDRLSSVKVADAAGNVLLAREALDPHMSYAWNDFAKIARTRHTLLAQCDIPGATVAKFCNTATGDRGEAPRAAQTFALMYLLSGNPDYLTDARKYAERIIGTTASNGGEWSANGRLAALALIYDWLYPQFAGDKVFLDKMVDTIKANIIAPKEAGSDRYPMLAGICGEWNSLADAAVFDCPNEIVYENWDGRTGASISNEYIGGHPTANAASVAMALLAIGHDRPEVKPMLETVATHYDLGFWRALRHIAVDGGHQHSWGYTATQTDPERLLIWRTSLADGGPFESEPWADKMIYPFIYGYKGRSRAPTADEFPASGDAIRIQSWGGPIGQLARSAAIQNKDSAAAFFYENIILPQRNVALSREVKDTNEGTGMDTLLEKLYWPDQDKATPAALPQDLSRHFRNAGRVLARDTWDFENATLFEFKSTNFASIQHHHLDQNSFTLFFKGPLALDTGVYDDYGSPHWHNYYIRSIAHNTITVFDPDEVFALKDTLSNDGGQWFVNGQVPVPTIEQILPADPVTNTPRGVNSLHGVEAYESDNAFTYVRGNASASYSSNKLDNTKGFIRSSVFLQPSEAWKKPVLIVYDQVRTNVLKRFLPTFLLHTDNEPYSPSATSTAPERGRSNISFTSAKRVFSVQNANKGAMVVQTLLPADATFTKAGGLNNGQMCKQVQTGRTDTPELSDCRFTARVKVGNNFEWLNFRPNFEINNGSVRREDMRESDKGGWRIEISPTAYAPTMEFLNVFSIKDVGAGDNLEPVAATRVGKGTNTEAIRVGQAGGYNLTVVFNKGADAPMEWEGNSVKGIVAVGLVPNQIYAISSNGATVTLQRAASGTRSSPDGVLHFE